jgi:uncharacterized LabA/DUF88 family protein
MRSTCSLYVDAGYLLAAAATRVTGTSLRSGIHVDYRPLIASMIAEAEERSGLPVLRVHWYDSARNGVPDAQQERIGELSKVKLRLGRFGVDGQQKGVDLRIGLDLVAHARNGAAEVFFLVSGDDDLTEAVEEAQVHGVEVVVLAVPSQEGKPHAVSRHLVRAADELCLLSPDVIDSAVMRVDVRRLPEPSADVPSRDTSVPTPAGDKNGATVPSPSPRYVAAVMSRPAPAVAASRLAYQGTTGGVSRVTPGYDDSEEYDEQIDAVVTKVLAAFRQSASPEDVATVGRAKPSIPRDIDRALLVDMSDALDVYDLNERIRYRLRERFWEQWG